MSQDETHRQSSKTADDAVESSKPSKRHRTILACLACRQKKRRCDGGRPQCQRCVRTTTSCEYTVEFYAVPQQQSETATVTLPRDKDLTVVPVQPPASHAEEPSALVGQVDGVSVPRYDNVAGPSFPFDRPSAWQHDLERRTDLLPSPNDTDATRPPALFTADGLPDSNGLDEWTQLFLQQVFHGHSETTSDARQRMAQQQQQQQQPGPSAYHSNSNLHPDQAQLQRQLSSSEQHSPNSYPFLNVLRDTISPQRSNGSGKRVSSRGG
jgi:hypothetical protein